MENDTFPEEGSSATPLFQPQSVEEIIIKMVSGELRSTGGVSTFVDYRKEIAVYGQEARIVSVPVHIEQEQRRYTNLVANRGQVETETIATQEE